MLLKINLIVKVIYFYDLKRASSVSFPQETCPNISDLHARFFPDERTDIPVGKEYVTGPPVVLGGDAQSCLRSSLPEKTARQKYLPCCFEFNSSNF